MPGGKEHKKGRQGGNEGFGKLDKAGRAQQRKQRREGKQTFQPEVPIEQVEVIEVPNFEPLGTSREDLALRLSERFSLEDSTLTQEYDTDAITRSVVRTRTLSSLNAFDQGLGRAMVWQASMEEIDPSYSLSYIFPERNDPSHVYSRYSEGQTPSNFEGFDWNDIAFDQNRSGNFPETRNRFTNIPERNGVVLPIGFIIDQPSGLFDGLLYTAQGQQTAEELVSELRSSVSAIYQSGLLKADTEIVVVIPENNEVLRSELQKARELWGTDPQQIERLEFTDAPANAYSLDFHILPIEQEVIDAKAASVCDVERAVKRDALERKELEKKLEKEIAEQQLTDARQATAEFFTSALDEIIKKRHTFADNYLDKQINREKAKEKRKGRRKAYFQKLRAERRRERKKLEREIGGKPQIEQLPRVEGILQQTPLPLDKIEAVTPAATYPQPAAKAIELHSKKKLKGKEKGKAGKKEKEREKDNRPQEVTVAAKKDAEVVFAEKKSGQLHPAEREGLMEFLDFLKKIPSEEFRRRFISLFTRSISAIQLFESLYVAHEQRGEIKAIAGDVSGVLRGLDIDTYAIKRWIMNNQKILPTAVVSEVPLPFGDSNPSQAFVLDNREGKLIDLVNADDDASGIQQVLQSLTGLSIDEIRMVANEVNSLTQQPFSKEHAELSNKRLILGVQGYRRDTPMPADFISNATLVQNAQSNITHNFAQMCRQMLLSDKDITRIPGNSAVYERAEEHIEGFSKWQKAGEKVMLILYNDGAAPEQFPQLFHDMRGFFRIDAENTEHIAERVTTDVLNAIRKVNEGEKQTLVVPVLDHYAQVVFDRLQQVAEQEGLADILAFTLTSEYAPEYNQLEFNAERQYHQRYTFEHAQKYADLITSRTNDTGKKEAPHVAEAVRQLMHDEQLFAQFVREGSIIVQETTIDRRTYDDHIAEAIWNPNTLLMILGMEALKYPLDVLGTSKMNYEVYFRMLYDFEILASMITAERFMEIFTIDENRVAITDAKATNGSITVEKLKAVLEMFSSSSRDQTDESQSREAFLLQAGRNALADLRRPEFHKK